jgi:hypothetical protein
MPINRDQPNLMPPSLTDWLEKDHFARFVIDFTETIDISPFLATYSQSGTGATAFHQLIK